MKTTFTSLLVLLFFLNATAQSNYYKLSLGAGYGLTQSFTDLPAHDVDRAMYGTADYFFTPFTSLGGEFQVGKIKAGTNGNDPYGRMFVNSYNSVTLNGKLYLGALIGSTRSSVIQSIRWLYAGVGVGAISNKMDTINRVKMNPQGTPYTFPGSSTSTELLIPLNLGINFYFPDYSGKPRFAINVNFQSNITVGEGLDGYNDPPIRFKSGSPDIYNYISIGLKYNFGLIGLSYRSLY